MTRCQELYKIVKNALESHDFTRLEKICKGEATKLYRVKTYVRFHDSYMPSVPYGLISETAIRPLISVGDPDVVSKAVEKLKPMLTTDKRGRAPRITGEDVKKVLGEVQGQPYLSPPERKAVRSEISLKQTEAACNGFLNMNPSDRSCLLNDLRRIIDTLGTWAAHVDNPALSSRIRHVGEQVDALRTELLMFLPSGPQKTGSEQVFNPNLYGAKPLQKPGVSQQ